MSAKSGGRGRSRRGGRRGGRSARGGQARGEPARGPRSSGPPGAPRPAPLPLATIRYAICTGCDEVIVLTDPPDPPIATQCGGCLLEMELDGAELRTLDQISDELDIDADADADDADADDSDADDADADDDDR